MVVKPMNFNDGPLVWIDCEMTGLDPQKDKILEIAVRFKYVPVSCQSFSLESY